MIKQTNDGSKMYQYYLTMIFIIEKNSNRFVKLNMNGYFFQDVYTRHYDDYIRHKQVKGLWLLIIARLIIKF